MLIIGASGFLGKFLYNTLKQDSTFEVTGTRFSASKDKYLPFDITKDSIKNIITFDKEPEKYAVICSALSSISIVENNRNIAYDFNVVKTKNLIEELIVLGYKIVFISSSSVYSGLTDYDTEKMPMNPSTLYGKTKAEVETYIRGICDDCVILRSAKIIHYGEHPKNLLSEYHKMAIEGGIFNCIENSSLSVVDVSDVSNVLSIIIKTA